MTASRADRPPLKEEATDDCMEIPDLFGGLEGDFIIQVDSATADSAGIRAGDYVFVRPTDQLEPGAIVVTVVGEGEEREAVACSADSNPPPDSRNLGVVIGLLRKI